MLSEVLNILYTLLPGEMIVVDEQGIRKVKVDEQY